MSDGPDQLGLQIGSVRLAVKRSDDRLKLAGRVPTLSIVANDNDQLGRTAASNCATVNSRFHE